MIVCQKWKCVCGCSYAGGSGDFHGCAFLVCTCILQQSITYPILFECCDECSMTADDFEKL